jgi:HEAT repeat protein
MTYQYINSKNKKESVMNYKKIMPFCAVILFVLMTNMSMAEDTLSQAQSLLTEIKKYDFGQSREVLTQFSDLLRSNYNSPEKMGSLEKLMAEFLATDATYAAKQYMCKELSIVGTEVSVPVLEKLLMDQETSDMARYALERIPGAKVDEVLRKALDKSEGKVKIGVINTLGERRDAQSVDQLAQLLLNADSQTVAASAAALGKIGGEKAAAALAQIREKVNASVQNEVLDAYLKIADNFASNGAAEKASVIYKELFVESQPLPIQAAALTGLVKAAGDRGGSVILDVLKRGNPQIQAVAISMIRELPKTAAVDAIAGEMGGLPVLAQIQILSAFQDRGDKSVHGVVLKALENENVDVRIAALQALAVLGNETDVKVFTKFAVTGEQAEKETAQKSLDLLNGEQVDATILSTLAQADAPTKVELVRSIGARNMVSAVGTLLSTAKDSNQKVRVETFKTLAEITDPKDIVPVIDLLVKVTTDVERREAEKAVVTIAHRIPDKKHQADAVLAVLPSVQDAVVHGSLLQVLGRIGDTESLPMLKNALKDKNPELSTAAIRALSEWPSPEPINDLLNVIKTGQDDVQKILALRGFIRLAGLESDRPAEETLKMYQTAMGLATEANEKRMVLSGIAHVPLTASLEMAAGYFNDKDLKEEAEVAAVQLAWDTRELNAARSKEILGTLLKNSTNKSVLENARWMYDNVKEK